MQSRETPVSGKGRVIALLVEKPWLLPFLYHIYSLQGATLNELKEILGLKTYIIKRGVWWLVKSGIVEKSGDKYVVSKAYVKPVEEIMMYVCTSGREYVVKMGSTYFVTIVHRTRITAYTVPEYLFREFLNRKLENRSVKDIASETGYSVKLVARVLKLYSILDICKK